MRSMFSGQGYYLSDDSASGGKRVEDDILSCTHCQAVMKKSEWKAGQTGAYCPVCDGPICTGCTARMQKFGCEPYAKKFTAIIDDHYRKEQNAKVMGI